MQSTDAVVPLLFEDVFVLVGFACLAGGCVFVAPSLTLAVFVTLWALWPKRPSPVWGWVAVAAFVVGSVRSQVRIRRYEHLGQQWAAHFPSPRRCEGEARVQSSPQRRGGSFAVVVVGDELRCEGELLEGEGLWALRTEESGLARGDRLAFVAQLAPPSRFWNEETGDPRPRQARAGFVLTGEAYWVELRSKGWGPAAWVDRWRAHLRSRIEATFPEVSAPMARALVLGETDLSKEDAGAFRDSGLAHLLAVSGMHLILVVGTFDRFLTAVLRRVPMLSASRDVRVLSAWVSVIVVWVYAQVAGASGSANRAAGMMTVLLAGRMVGRTPNGCRAFGLSVAGFAWVDPLAIYDLSFLLSLAATLGLMVGEEPLRRRWIEPWVPSFLPFRRAGIAALASTVAATVACAPLLADLGPTLPLGGILANLLAIPLGELAALPLCLVHGFLGPVPWAEKGVALLAASILGALRGVATAFAGQASFQVPVAPLSPLQWSVLLVAGAFGVFRPKRRSFAVGLGILGLLLAEVPLRVQGKGAGHLRVTFLDVGQGDAALIDFPTGELFVVDGGGVVGAPVDPGALVLLPVLRARRRGAVDAVVLSHPHPDHFLGLSALFEALPSKAFWDTGQGETEGHGGPYGALLEGVRRRGVQVVRPSELCGTHHVGGATLAVLAPCPGPEPDGSPNDNSFVFKLSYGAHRFLFVGDAESREEGTLLRAGVDLSADVLKVGHHGSRTSTSRPFLEAVNPRIAVISAGRRNRFGHPHRRTLETLEDPHRSVYRTDRDGSVTVETDGEHLWVRTAGRR